MTDWHDGQDIDRKQAREATRRMLEDPSKRRAKGHPDDEATRDTPIDPDTAEGDDE